jgi:hypothetical protein
VRSEISFRHLRWNVSINGVWRCGGLLGTQRANFNLSLPRSKSARMVNNSFSRPDGFGISQSFTDSSPSLYLTMDQDRTVLIVERVMSIISIAATIFVLASFILFDELKRKTFNRLLFLASWGNILTNVATLMGRSGLDAGQKSATCKIQATLIQW